MAHALILLGGFWAAASAWADPPRAATRTPVPVIEPARGERCVADPAFMRRNHMDLLRHQRVETVQAGVRGARHSLVGCIECHGNAQTRSVAAQADNFCVSCHRYAAVRIDCFECHNAKGHAADRPAATSALDFGGPAARQP